ncbi:hypothetical protein LINPERPRIM_LOCUS32276 [Linum perenne]
MSPPPRASPFDEDDIHDTVFARQGCCFCFSNLLRNKPHAGGDGGAAGSSAAFWQRIRPAESPPWWRTRWNQASGLSEVGDSPRWKRLVRRFNVKRNRRGSGDFHYDATSYALNFDDGPLGYYSDEDLHGRGFTDRYSLPPSAKCSMDYDQDLNYS